MMHHQDPAMSLNLPSPSAESASNLSQEPPALVAKGDQAIGAETTSRSLSAADLLGRVVAARDIDKQQSPLARRRPLPEPALPHPEPRRRTGSLHGERDWHEDECVSVWCGGADESEGVGGSRPTSGRWRRLNCENRG